MRPHSSMIRAPTFVAALATIVVAACSPDLQSPLAISRAGASLAGTDYPWRVQLCKLQANDATASFSVSASSGQLLVPNEFAITAPPAPQDGHSCEWIWGGVAGGAVTLTVDEHVASGITVDFIAVDGHPTAGVSISGTMTVVTEEYLASHDGVATIIYRNVPTEVPDACPNTIGGVNVGDLTGYLFVFTDGHVDANWQSASKGYVGNVAVNGLLANERTSGTIAYAGTIFTNDATLGAWQKIVDANPGQATAAYNDGARIDALTASLNTAFAQVNALVVTPGFESRTAASLNGLNTQNGISEVTVINITSGMGVSSKINITGDAGDSFVLRWDSDADFSNGYQGTVKFQSGGAIVPLGGLTAGNFVHVAGNISASGGGSTPASPYPQGPRLDNGAGALINGAQDFNGGGFFTGYWLTTGNEKGETSSLSNAIFIGGWYSTTNKFSMTSGTSGVNLCPGNNSGH